MAKIDDVLIELKSINKKLGSLEKTQQEQGSTIQTFKENFIMIRKNFTGVQDNFIGIKKNLTDVEDNFTGIKKSFANVQDNFTIIHDTLTIMQKNFTSLKRYARKTNKTVDIMARLYNQEDVNLKKRVDRLERHKKLPPLHVF